MKLTKAIETAAQAHTNLTMFHAIISLAESGGFYGPTPELSGIIRAAKAGAGRCLRQYDRAVAEAGRAEGSAPPHTPDVREALQQAIAAALEQSMRHYPPSTRPMRCNNAANDVIHAIRVVCPSALAAPPVGEVGEIARRAFVAGYRCAGEDANRANPAGEERLWQEHVKVHPDLAILSRQAATRPVGEIDGGS